MILALGSSEASAGHLGPQNGRFRRPRRNDAPDIFVDAGRQDTDRANELGDPCPAALEDFFANEDGRVRVHILAGDASPDKAGVDVLAVRSIYAKAERRPILAFLIPSLNHIANEAGVVHYFRQRANIVVVTFDVSFDLA